MPTKLRPMRFADDVWDPALAKARREGSSVTAVVRDFLVAYGAAPDGVDLVAIIRDHLAGAPLPPAAAPAPVATPAPAARPAVTPPPVRPARDPLLALGDEIISEGRARAAQAAQVAAAAAGDPHAQAAALLDAAVVSRGWPDEKIADEYAELTRGPRWRDVPAGDLWRYTGRRWRIRIPRRGRRGAVEAVLVDANQGPMGITAVGYDAGAGREIDMLTAATATIYGPTTEEAPRG